MKRNTLLAKLLIAAFLCLQIEPAMGRCTDHTPSRGAKFWYFSAWATFCGAECGYMAYTAAKADSTATKAMFGAFSAFFGFIGGIWTKWAWQVDSNYRAQSKRKSELTKAYPESYEALARPEGEVHPLVERYETLVRADLEARTMPARMLNMLEVYYHFVVTGMEDEGICPAGSFFNTQQMDNWMMAQAKVLNITQFYTDRPELREILGMSPVDFNVLYVAAENLHAAVTAYYTQLLANEQALARNEGDNAEAGQRLEQLGQARAAAYQAFGQSLLGLRERQRERDEEAQRQRDEAQEQGAVERSNAVNALEAGQDNELSSIVVEPLTPRAAANAEVKAAEGI